MELLVPRNSKMRDILEACCYARIARSDIACRERVPEQVVPANAGSIVPAGCLSADGIAV